MNYWQRLVRTVVAADPVVELEEIKKHCRVEYFTDDDEYLTELVEVATAFIEGPSGIGICLMPQTWRLSLDYFPSEIVIPLGPVTAITGITYTDSDGDAATVSTWRTDHLFALRARPAARFSISGPIRDINRVETIARVS